jgi:spore coat protein U-like protein
MRLARILAATLLAAPAFVSAATPVSSTFQVRAEVKSACTVSATDIVVASYDPNAIAPTNQTGTVSVTCTKGTGYSTVLSAPSGFKMTGPGGAVLAYQIFQGSGTGGTVWANATTSNPYAGSAPTKAAVAYLATASIDAGQDVPAGFYADTVTVTVNY